MDQHLKELLHTDLTIFQLLSMETHKITGSHLDFVSIYLINCGSLVILNAVVDPGGQSDGWRSGAGLLP